MSKKFLYITSILSCIGIFVQAGFTGIPGVVSGIIEIIFCGILSASIGALLYKDTHSWRYRIIRASLIFAAVIGFFSALVLVFIGYQYLTPGAVGKVILTNGERNIVFYQMSHIATVNFYNRIQSDLGGFMASGYQIYAEGVRPGTKENQERFDTLMGIKMTTSLYTTFAQMLGLVAQSNDLYAGIPEGSLDFVDVSIDDIIATIGTGSLQGYNSPTDIESELADYVGIDSGFLVKPFFRAFLNFLIKNQSSSEYLMAGLSQDLTDVILDKRNEYVINYFYTSNDKNIVFLYGALHFEGMYRILRARDPRWKIVSIDSLYPYSY